MEYAESSYIAIATLLVLQVLLVGVPLTFLVRDNPTAEFFIKVCIIFFICTATTLLIFVPKFIRNRKAAKEKEEGSNLISWSNNNTKNNDVDAMKGKIVDLKSELQEQGFDSNALFQKVGLE